MGAWLWRRDSALGGGEGRGYRGVGEGLGSMPRPLGRQPRPFPAGLSGRGLSQVDEGDGAGLSGLVLLLLAARPALPGPGDGAARGEHTEPGEGLPGGRNPVVGPAPGVSGTAPVG